jgi:hypothetical protein
MHTTSGIFGFNATYDVPNQTGNPAGVFATLPTQETNASYCNQNGDLWFYSNGTSLKNRISGINQLNSLNSCPNTPGSTAQGIIFLPKPGAPFGQFYIFTTSDAQSPTPFNFGLSYYDYNANTSTLGSLQRPTTNFHTTEGLTIVPHCNGTDYWVIVKPIINPTIINPNNANIFVPSNPNTWNVTANSLLSYLVTSSGVSNIPVITNFPPTTGYTPDPTNSFNWVSIMKSSPNRDLFAISERMVSGGAINLYRFNCATGQFSFITRQTQTGWPYGLSFSGNSQYLYTGNGQNSILQYDVTDLWDPTIQCYSLPTQSIPVSISDPTYQMQLASDGMILIANPNSNHLDRLLNPNSSNPGYQDVAIGLSASTPCRWGLPNNIDGICNTILPIDFEACVCGCKVDFRFLGCGGDITWDFGDGTVMTGAAFSNIPPNNTFTTGTFMSPSHAYTHSGTYTVTVSSSGQTATHSVVFNPLCDSEWNVASGDPLVNHWEQGNDIVTDAAGNIYVAGSYRRQALFKSPNGCADIVLPGNNLIEYTAFIAKYNSCGELIWVNFENSIGMSTGTSLALDPTRQIVYLTGLTDNDLRFQATAAKPCGSPSPGTLMGGPTQAYIAKFSTITGNFIDAQPLTASVAPDMIINITARNVNATTTDIYYSYTYSQNGNKYFDVRKVRNIGSAYLIQWITSNVITGAMDLTVNDIVINGTNSLVYFGGSFRGSLRLSGSPTISSLSCQDGFMAALDATTGTYIAGTLRSAGIIGGLSDIATITGLATDGSNTYFVGYSTQSIPNIFGSTMTFTGTFGKKASFILKYPSNMGLLTWGREIRSSTGDVEASGVVTATKAVVLTGSFNEDITFPTAFIANGTFSSSLNKVFIANYNSAGSELWLNATNDNQPGSSLHIPTRVAYSGTFTYTTGGFTGNLGYNSVGTPGPPSGPLNFAPSPAGPLSNQNLFIIRNDFGNSTFREYEEESNEDPDVAGSASEKNVFNALIYPNPNNGYMQVKIHLDESSVGTLIINDITGKKVLDFSLQSSENNFEIKGNDLNAGIYFYSVVVNGRVMQSNKIVIIK